MFLFFSNLNKTLQYETFRSDFEFREQTAYNNNSNIATSITLQRSREN